MAGPSRSSASRGFRDYWWLTWGARGLLYVWSPKVAPAAALRTLGRVGDTEHVPAVRSALGDTDSQVRRAAALALERMVARLDLPGEVLP